MTPQFPALEIEGDESKRSEVGHQVMSIGDRRGRGRAAEGSVDLLDRRGGEFPSPSWASGLPIHGNNEAFPVGKCRQGNIGSPDNR